MLFSTASFAAEVVVGPTLAMDPNGVTPLAGVVTLTTDVATRAEMIVTSDQDTWWVGFSGYRTAHSLPVLGLKPDQLYSVQVSITDPLNVTVPLPVLEAVTGALPSDFPVIDVYYSDPRRMEPGYILMDKFRRFGSGGEFYAIIVDNQGEVVWYSTSGGSNGMRKLPNGNLMLIDSSEMTLLGESIVRRVLDVRAHALFPAESGHFFGLSYNQVTVDNFPTSEIDPNAPTESTDIYSDVIAEFLPDGTLENSWDLTQIIDPTRIGYDAGLPGFPFFDLPDWSHSNAITYDPSDDSVIVSVRHQDAVIKVSRTTGELIWILGPHDNWAPEYQRFLLSPVGSTFEWQYHQHAQTITPQGTILLFDNGNHRASPFDGRVPLSPTQNYSRAVEYLIDDVNMEVQQVWEYGVGIEWPLYSPTQGDADWMPTTGNVLITFSDTEFIAGLPSSDWGLGRLHTTIVEVDHETPANKLFDMRVYDPAPSGSVSVYRSEKIASLYPDDVIVVRDSDTDGVFDIYDNCILEANTDQRDTDGDNFGNVCDADLDNNGVVEWVDLSLFEQLFGSADPDADFDGDGDVNFSDWQVMFNSWLGSPGPSALAPSS